MNLHFAKISKDVEFVGEPSPLEWGGKAVSLIKMTKMGLPVPPGFVIPTSVCMAYFDSLEYGVGMLMDIVMEQVEEHMLWLDYLIGCSSAAVSVRSGAPVSMPGMCDTKLNVEGTANIRKAVEEVILSWMSPRAIEYRKLNGISDQLGTAVTIQAMVHGDFGMDSGTGVLFTRDPSTGNPTMMGEFLLNSLGEDIVSGVKTPMALTEMHEIDKPWPGIHHELTAVCATLEAHYRDMVDIEFTVEGGDLYILQSRVGKRSAAAAFKIAVDMVAEGLISQDEGLSRIKTEQFKALRRKIVDPTFKAQPFATGLPACPGVASGRPVFTSAEAVAATDHVILVTKDTSPDDIAGMAAARGVLTQTGGVTSHAAVVARAMDKPCVTACDLANHVDIADAKFIVIDGTTGNVWVDVKVPFVDGSGSPEVATVTQWCVDRQKPPSDELRPVPPMDQMLLTHQGQPIVASPQAVPPEYAVFVTLAEYANVQSGAQGGGYGAGSIA